MASKNEVFLSNFTDAIWSEKNQVYLYRRAEHFFPDH